MMEMEQKKRYALVVALVSQQIARCLDDLGEMLIKRMRKAHRRAQQALLEYRQRHHGDCLANDTVGEFSNVHCCQLCKV